MSLDALEVQHRAIKSQFETEIVKPIKAVSLGVLSRDNVRRASVCQVVTDTSLYQKDTSKVHKKGSEVGGLFDLRLGPPNKNQICKTCKQRVLECPGHHGHIELERRVLNPEFIDHIRNVLQCICWHCSLVKLHPGSKLYLSLFDKNDQQRFRTVLKHCQDVKICKYVEGDSELGCGSIQPTFHKDTKTHVILYMSFEDHTLANTGLKKQKGKRGGQGTTKSILSNQKIRLTPDSIYTVLNRIDEDQYYILGFDKDRCKPTSLVLENLVVPPPFIRPSHGAGGEDPITHKLSDISRANNKLVKPYTERFLPPLIDPSEVSIASATPAAAETFHQSSSEHVPDASSSEIKKPTVEDIVKNIAEAKGKDEEEKKEATKTVTTASSYPKTVTYKTYNGNRDDTWRMMQFHTTALMNCKLLPVNLARKLMMRLGDYVGKLVKKHGLMRDSLLGKRINFTHRSVITPDPSLDIHEIGISLSACKILYWAEAVNDMNINMVKECVIRGPEQMGGANSVKFDPTSNLMIDLGSTTESERMIIAEGLKTGMVVNRHYRDGEWVIICRQPSLHKFNIMAFQVKIRVGSSTMSLHPLAPTPFGADFDGDEMNIYPLINLQTVAEAKELMAFERNPLTPQTSSPVYGFIQDELLASYMMTHKDTFFTRSEAMELLQPLIGRDEVYGPLEPKYEQFSFALPLPAIWIPETLWTGKQILSMLFPRDLNEWRGTLNHNVQENVKDLWNNTSDSILVIRNGQIMSGHLDKKSMGCTSNGLIHKLANDYSSDVFATVLNRLHHVLSYYIGHMRPVTIGLSDIQTPKGFKPKLQSAIELIDSRIDEWVKKGVPDTKIEEMVWGVIGKLSKHLNADLISSMDSGSNNFLKILNAGTKGSSKNASQVTRVVDQQVIKGGRLTSPVYGFGKRAFPWSIPGDKSLVSCGFIDRSYSEGMGVQGFAIAAMCGREGMIDTSVRTSIIGYKNRQLCGSTSDIVVQQDMCVMNAQKVVVQFSFGDDGFDASYSENQTMFYSEQHLCGSERDSFNSLKDTFRWSDNMVKKNPVLKHEFHRINRDRLLLRTNFGDPRKLNVSTKQLLSLPVSDKDLILNESCKILAPVNFKRFLERAQSWQYEHSSSSLNNSKPLTVNPATVVNTVYNLQRWMFGYMGTHHRDNWDLKYFILLRSYLTSKVICKQWKLSTEIWFKLLEEIVQKFRKSICQAGEAVGVISAQSVSQTFTQMTLSNLHFQGSDKAFHTNAGVERLCECINATRKIKQPVMNVRLVPPFNKIKTLAVNCMRSIQCVRLKSIVDSISIVSHDCPSLTCIEPFLSNPLVAQDIESIPSNWVAMIRLKTDVFKKFPLSMSDIAYRVWKRYPRGATVRYTLEWTTEEVKDALLNYETSTFEDSPTIVKTEHDDDDRVSPRKSSSNVRSVVGESTATNGPYLTIRLSTKIDVSLAKIMLQDFCHQVLERVSVQGLIGIDNCYLQQDQNTKEYFIVTKGTDMSNIFKFPFVCKKRTSSNDTIEMERRFGIEAYRSVLIRELVDVLSIAGKGVNMAHLKLLSDAMSYPGEVIPMTRHGINRIHGSGVFEKAAFEELMNQICKGAVFSKLNIIKGPSEKMIMGLPHAVGTGLCDVHIDTDKLLRFDPNLYNTKIKVSGSNFSDHQIETRQKGGIIVLEDDDVISGPGEDSSPFLRNYSTSPGINVETQFSDISPLSNCSPSVNTLDEESHDMMDASLPFVSVASQDLKEGQSFDNRPRKNQNILFSL